MNDPTVQDRKELYLAYLLISKNLITKVREYPEILKSPVIQKEINQLEAFTQTVCTDFCFLNEFINQLKKLKQLIKPYFENRKDDFNQEEGKSNSYMKVKKAGNCFEEEPQEITKPDYHFPFMKDQPSVIEKPRVGEEMPGYIYGNYIIPSLSNRGSSNILMLGVISFLTEILFLFLAFFIYQ